MQLRGCDDPDIFNEISSRRNCEVTQVEIDEIYIFKLDSPLTSKDEYHLKLTIDLIQVENDRERIVGNYNASINGQAQH